MSEESKKLAKLKLEKVSTHFSSAHLVVDPHYSEEVHGHNYLVEVGIRGEIGDFGMILNFLGLDKLVHKISKEWDHFLLLPKNNPYLSFIENKGFLEFTIGDHYYSVPINEVVILDCVNVTTEELSRLFSLRIYNELKFDCMRYKINEVTVTIWETPFYSASYTINCKSL
ncbi:MAG: 6-pyruvoyl trahydropterin synthase family protein [Candidatus Hodarchaeales archaeon]